MVIWGLADLKEALEVVSSADLTPFLKCHETSRNQIKKIFVGSSQLDMPGSVWFVSQSVKFIYSLILFCEIRRKCLDRSQYLLLPLIFISLLQVSSRTYNRNSANEPFTSSFYKRSIRPHMDFTLWPTNQTEPGMSNWLEPTKIFLFDFSTFYDILRRGSDLRNWPLPVLPLGLLSLIWPFWNKLYSFCCPIVSSCEESSIKLWFSYKKKFDFNFDQIF